MENFIFSAVIVIMDGNSSTAVCQFFVEGYNICSFTLGGEHLFSMLDLKMIPRHLHMCLPNICNMRMLSLLCPCALFGLKFSKHFSMFCSKVTFDQDLSAFRKIIDGILLLFFIEEHCLAKKEFNNSALSLKSVINPLSQKNGRIHGIFLFKKDLMIDQYVLGLVDLYIDFLIHDNNVPAYRVLIERFNYFKNCKFSNKSLSLLILMQHLYALFFC